ncbi:UDP-N-acetylmuramate dehydrogenase [Patescibacteria group bacterium]|nr:UDP-N-acetylmuramate dehydrogenase [Patescibacteria group bacterium]MBU3999603.1 UDP-N-acetylmuramate dehydrogenase [Patescibacteria group bacterium]MBU4056343.1 UDP-N-acetylmuramate dehydrogenase [Patescibacteria group bacterium]MBU4368963.1 UDP-N-acetylmuramate dehydrogenase [Patescibacteria group bacterium]
MADIKSLLKGVQENVSLAQYTTFKIGGPARYFYIAKTTEEIVNAVKIAKSKEIPFYILGNGSNVLVSDQGFNGMVIKILNTKYQILNTAIEAGAGVNLNKLVMVCAEAGLTGLEWAIGIPGTVAGAIVGNAGAFGRSMSEFAESVEIFDTDALVQRAMSNSGCEFGYRSSIFQPKADQYRVDKERKNYIIIKITLRLAKGDPEKSKRQIREYLKKRKERHPLGPSAGSVFKNPSIAENQKAFGKLAKKFPEAEKFRATGKIPAGWLVDELGLHGRKIGGAMISEKHGNFILNAGEAKAADVITLVSLIKQKVRVNFGIQLQEEIQYVGF